MATEAEVLGEIEAARDAVAALVPKDFCGGLQTRPNNWVEEAWIDFFSTVTTVLELGKTVELVPVDEGSHPAALAVSGLTRHPKAMRVNTTWPPRAGHHAEVELQGTFTKLYGKFTGERRHQSRAYTILGDSEGVPTALQIKPASDVFYVPRTTEFTTQEGGVIVPAHSLVCADYGDKPRPHDRAEAWSKLVVVRSAEYAPETLTFERFHVNLLSENVWSALFDKKWIPAYARKPVSPDVMSKALALTINYGYTQEL